MKMSLILTSALVLSFPAAAQESPYAGQQERQIKSLSPDDISELQRGGGWGLAKAAELNGVPGPAHLLEMAAEIPLDDGQVARIRAIYNAMQDEAIAKGLQLIELETELETHFQDRTITDELLRELLASIGRTRTELRYIHLATHLQTPDILTEAQIERYNKLRGYDNPDPCANVPEGHDAEMWRAHNGCN